MKRAIQDLYFIRNPASGLVKIGVAMDVAKRLRGLECACGTRLELLARVVCGGRFEGPLHLAFDDVRRVGEWFVPTPELLALTADPRRIPGFLRAREKQIAAVRAARSPRGSVGQQMEQEAAFQVG